jgi:hypothetical protein
MKKPIYCLFLMAALGAYSNSSFALGQLSRACRFPDIPPGGQTVAALFFSKVGAPSSVMDLPNQALGETSHWWILESLTLDWGQARYYLFAANKVFYNSSIQPNPIPGGHDIYYYTPMNFADGTWMEYQSAWTSQEITAAMRADPNFSPYYANRQWLYSARAGSPNIVERYNLNYPAGFNVLGKHWYYDAQMGIRTNLADTSATSCNLTDMGNLSSFSLGLFDR